MDTITWVQQGNIRTTNFEKGKPGRYQGNGRLGSVFSAFGLNEQPERQRTHPKEGRSHFTHMKHWGRFRFLSEAMNHETTADYILPLFRLYWEQEPQQVTEYMQTQDFYDGTLITNFTHSSGEQIQVTSWFDMVQKDLAVFFVDVSKGIFPIRLAAVTDFVPYPFLYKKETKQIVTSERCGDCWKLIISCPDTVNERSSDVYLHTNAPVEVCEGGLRIIAGEGRTEILLSYGKPVQHIDPQTSRKQTAETWHTLWEKSGWFLFPDEQAQKVWVRSLAYLLSSYQDAGEAIQPANGLTGNMFPFHFVQDLAYIVPALMMTGHVDIVQHWVEKFAGEIEAMSQYARHLWPQAQGIYPPWELPYGEIDSYHSPGVPIIYCYEPHNVGYLCRIATDAAAYVDDPNWTAQYAVPLIRECAAFYRSFATKGADGHWHLKWYPCVGQDEAGGQNQSDYLCCLYSAKYCFTAAFLFDVEESDIYAGILQDGLAFESLLSERGTYRTCHNGSGIDDFGRQKHPVQLDGIAYLPTDAEPQEAEQRAYALRHSITGGAQESFYEGWTLGEFLLAGSNLGDTGGWLHDWAELRTANYTDPDWVQIYETSGQAEKSFYMATHGLILQSLLRNYVNDYWERLDFAGCPVYGDDVEFGNIRTQLGMTVSGRAHDGICDYTLYAWKNCRVFIGEKLFDMKKGDVLHGTHRFHVE